MLEGEHLGVQVLGYAPLPHDLAVLDLANNVGVDLAVYAFRSWNTAWKSSSLLVAESLE